MTLAATYYIVGAALPGFPSVTWRVCEDDCPVRFADDPEGLDGPPHDPIYQDEAHYAGSWWKGQTEKPNVITVSYRFNTNGSLTKAEAVEAAKAWRRSVGRGRELAEFHVVDEDAGTDRWQWVRANDTWKGLPLNAIRSHGFYGTGTPVSLALTSDKALWESRPVIRDAATNGTVITNGGDFAAWPQYEIVGPTTGFGIGLDGETVRLKDLTAGQKYVIETDPAHPPLIHRDGVDAWAEAAGIQRWLNPAPPKAASTVTTTGTAQSVKITLPQQHWAATD